MVEMFSKTAVLYWLIWILSYGFSSKTISGIPSLKPMKPSPFIAAHRRTAWQLTSSDGWMTGLFGQGIANKVKMLALLARTPWTAMKSNGWRRSRYQAFSKPSVVLLFLFGKRFFCVFGSHGFRESIYYSVSVQAAHLTPDDGTPSFAKEEG